MWLRDVLCTLPLSLDCLADPTFRAEIEAVKAELAAICAKGLKPTRDCQAETEVIK